jgi:hypothetical protein
VLEAIIGLALGGVIILVLLYVRLRRAFRQERLARHDSWDEMMVGRLRTQGYHPFNAYRVDFFLGLPNPEACEAVRRQLEQEGFEVDVKHIQDETDLPYSLNASKSMQLLVPDIQAFSRRMSALAAEHHGRYDHWAA